MPRINYGGSDMDTLANDLIVGLKTGDSSPWRIDKKLPFEADRLRNELVDAITKSSCLCRDRVDTLTSFGVESIRDDKGIFQDTALRMVRAGDSTGNGLLAYGNRILDETTKADLHSAMAASWTYEDERCALRWDPAEYHGYAMQWTNPSTERTVSGRGGNRLALAAMSLLPTIPHGAKVATVAFCKTKDRNDYFTWPLWNVPCCVNVVRSLLTLPGLQGEQPSPRDLQALGIGAVYRCDRIMTSTYYRNFTPARRIA